MRKRVQLAADTAWHVTPDLASLKWPWQYSAFNKAIQASLTEASEAGGLWEDVICASNSPVPACSSVAAWVTVLSCSATSNEGDSLCLYKFGCGLRSWEAAAGERGKACLVLQWREPCSIMFTNTIIKIFIDYGAAQCSWNNASSVWCLSPRSFDEPIT
jgi:hypothetical protein